VALIYKAQVVPSKIEMLGGWIPNQPWLGDADISTFEPVGAYRFDDPAGAVGIETHLLGTADGKVLQVPVTYRDQALDGAESALISTAQHSVLGKRWVYDACWDPIYLQALTEAIFTGGTQVDLEFVTDNGLERHQATTQVSGSGSSATAVPQIDAVTVTNGVASTVVSSGALNLVVLRVLDQPNIARPTDDSQTLVGRWPGHEEDSLLAFGNG